MRKKTGFARFAHSDSGAAEALAAVMSPNNKGTQKRTARTRAYVSVVWRLRSVVTKIITTAMTPSAIAPAIIAL